MVQHTTPSDRGCSPRPQRPESLGRLEWIVADPDQAASVSVVEIPALLVQIASIQAILLSRLAVSSNGAKTQGPPADDRFLTAEEAAPIMNVTPRWMYRKARSLPFTRRINRKTLRFSEQGLRRYMASRKA